MNESEHKFTLQNKLELWLFDRLRVSYNGMDQVTELAQRIDATRETSPLSVVVVANHSSDIDTLLLLKIIDQFQLENKKILVSHRFDREFYDRMLERKDQDTFAEFIQAFKDHPDNIKLMKKYPFFRQVVALHGITTVPIPQSDYIDNTPLGLKNGRIAYHQLRNVVTEFSQQSSLLIVYPEGTRSPNGVLQPATAVLEAISRFSTKHIILPVTIIGSNAVKGKNQTIPNPFHAIRVVVSKPIDPQEYFKQGGSNLTNVVMETIATYLPHELQGMYSKVPGGGWR